VKLKMKPRLRAAAAGVLTAAIAGGGLLAFASPAFAAQSAPPWEVDAASAPPYGNLTFYDAAGDQVTSGTNLSSPFAYVVAGTAADTGATSASLAFYNPQPATPPVPGNWTGTSEAGPTTFSSGATPPTAALPSGTPADIVAFAPTYPVVASSAADISTWVTSNTPSTTTGYANTIEVRLTDSGARGAGNAAGTYWESDIGYNTTSSPITVDGTTVPADGWALLFPFTNSSSVTLTTTATGGALTSGSPITLTATVSPSTDAGGVQFYDNGTFLDFAATNDGTAGVYTYTYTPAAGAHSYTASFIPGDSPGDETGADTTSAAIVGGSISSAVPVSDSAPKTTTSTALAASSNSIASGASDTFTATVGAADDSTTGVTGSVEFFDGTTAITGCTAQATTVTGSGTTTSPGVGTATCTTSSLPAGSDSITATFTPTSTSYSASTSSAVPVQVAAPTACGLTGSSCGPDNQNIEVTISPGTLTITTPYTATNPFVLPAMALSSDGTYLQSSATFPAPSEPYASDIDVTSTLSPAQAWTVSVSATALTSSGNSIPASGLGLTAGALYNATTTAGAYGPYPGTVTFTNIPALNPSPIDGPGSGPGLSATPQSWATSTAADGTAVIYGTLTLDAATGTPAGTYSGTITFSVS